MGHATTSSASDIASDFLTAREEEGGMGPRTGSQHLDGIDVDDPRDRVGRLQVGNASIVPSSP
jgi:hypothetical protein